MGFLFNLLKEEIQKGFLTDYSENKGKILSNIDYFCEEIIRKLFFVHIQ